jgi:hypothetical protein
MERLTVGWNRRPPLYGPSAELNYKLVKFSVQNVKYLNAVAPIDLHFTFVIFPYHSELNDAFGDLLSVGVN